MAELREILSFCVQVLFTGGVLWAALKITKTQGDFSGMLLIAFVCGLLGLHPEPWGMLASLLVMFLLIAKFTSAKFFPETVVIVLLSWILGFLSKFALEFAARILVKQ